jgi:hypothetical protein
MFKARVKPPEPAKVLADYCRRMGFPAPAAEHEFAKPVRPWKFDFAWPGLKVALELEGGAFAGGRHTSGAGYRDDCAKYSEAALRGWLVLRVLTSDAHKPRSLGLVYRAMRARGVKA